MNSPAADCRGRVDPSRSTDGRGTWEWGDRDSRSRRSCRHIASWCESVRRNLSLTMVPHFRCWCMWTALAAPEGQTCEPVEEMSLYCSGEWRVYPSCSSSAVKRGCRRTAEHQMGVKINISPSTNICEPHNFAGAEDNEMSIAVSWSEIDNCMHRDMHARMQ